ncbi:OLC1v1016428C1 [Oldenlandia corymbosa var. corymbosa]|uniref:OLC1v1016428C1 n=1 Tax=Oldenlandia corymbosa var. corymbosa TaxID=529605 RepID=A0AAV1E7G8_OLDCO|nr:OLC1v1016428C1 [Oldenlandia corymbosa var. corymbosa]
MLSGITLGAGGYVPDFIENSSVLDSTSGVGKCSAAQESPEMYCMRNGVTSKRLDDRELPGAHAAADTFEPFAIDGLSSRYEQETAGFDSHEEAALLRNDEEEDGFVNGFGDEGTVWSKLNDSLITSPDVTCPSPYESSKVTSEVHEENKTPRGARSCKRASSNKVLLNFSSLQFNRRKRTVRKQARSTVWGLLGSDAPTLDQNVTLNIHPEKPKRSRKSRVADKGKQGKSGNHSSVKLTKERCIPTGPISLKVKFGKEILSTLKVMPISGSTEEDSEAEKDSFDPSKTIEDLSQEQIPGIMTAQSCVGYLEKASEMHLANAESIGANIDTPNDLEVSPLGVEDDKEVVTIESRVSDLGTSPDSEVINPTPDADISEKDPEILCHALNSTTSYLGSDNDVTFTKICKNDGEEKRKNFHEQTGNDCVSDEVPSPENLTNIVGSPKSGQEDIVGDVSYYSAASTSTSESASLNTLPMEGSLENPVPCSSMTELAISSDAAKDGSLTEANLSPKFAVKQELVKSNKCGTLLSCSKGKKLPKSSSVRKEKKSSSGAPNPSSNRGKATKTKSKKEKSSGKQSRKNKKDFDEILHEMGNRAETGFNAISGMEELREAGGRSESVVDISKKNTASPEVIQQFISPSAWVSCDDCGKWRRIPVALADQINETKCRWICKDNMDEGFADCSIPQEKSNADINAELDISDASCEEDECDLPLDSSQSKQKQLTVTQQSPWTLIKSNLFLHRRRKNQPIDEIMVCHCKPPSDGQAGCGDGCLNRMLNIECINGTCPCGDSCSNQKFQKRRYAKLKSIKCGKKGYGLQLLEDVSEGKFLIEYVGEVLDMHAYESRQKEYALKGHRHFYFMTLNGSEVIDASAKGNLGRFINHSCEPNCRTEKWMVNGEVCVGIFALRDIKKGEEVTFDYNYVRVFGAAAKKCVCGSSQCRGYIGGDPENAEEIVQGDSDEEYPEPVMVRGNGNINRNPSKTISRTKFLNGKEIRPEKDVAEADGQMDRALPVTKDLNVSPEEHARVSSGEDKIFIEGSTTAMMSSENTKEIRVSNRSSGLHAVIQLGEIPSPSDDITSENTSPAPEECSVTEKSISKQGSDGDSLYKLSDGIDLLKGSKSSVGEDRIVTLKSHTCTHISKKSTSVKKKKAKTDVVDVQKAPEIVNKVHTLPFSPKRLLEAISSGRFEAVQEKLNQLLDKDGGISKRKDASRGYLKLLLLTATSDAGGHGQAIQSNRDLSMILDALLKTKSKTVLVDVINKNGLQMLHNIMKRSRKEFTKIPVLRKLLKVLEYMASREIITSEHINWGPRCPGVESFVDSMLKLTEHSDRQVHQIARSFRDRWIPRCFRKYVGTNRDDSWMEFHRGSSHDRTSAVHPNWTDSALGPSEPSDCVAKPPVAMSNFDTKMPEDSPESRSKRKRKSRWDEPSKEISPLGPETNGCDGAQMDEDLPPGFCSPAKRPLREPDAYSDDNDHVYERIGCANHPGGVAIGHVQQRFISRFPVAYGVPMPVVEKFGIHESEMSENWIVAPGMPFQPFPPLPPYPRDRSKYQEMGQVVQKPEQDSHSQVSLDFHNHPTTFGSAVGMDLDGSDQSDVRRVRVSDNLSRKYFRQQKWNKEITGGRRNWRKDDWGPT